MRTEKASGGGSTVIAGAAEPLGPDYVGPLQLTTLPSGATPISGCVTISDGGSNPEYDRTYRAGTAKRPLAIDVSVVPVGEISASNGPQPHQTTTNYGAIIISDAGHPTVIGAASRMTSLTIGQAWVSINVRGAGTSSDVDAQIVQIVNGLRLPAAASP